ncbi:hypothetical protein LCGC14_0420520 [marine sediment metagenome]|uniref:Uncharacterized protein n=1 Tax=marine sediment metagenome TaxID=412755 RepID=A0A0F9W088_9ZZZZ
MGDKAYKLRHKEQGLCVNCSCLASPRYVLCASCAYKQKIPARAHRRTHREYYRNVASIYRARRESEGQCTRCGSPLIAGENKYCVNCNSHDLRRRL